MNNKLIFLAILALTFGACNDDETTKVITKKHKMTVTSNVAALVKSAGSTTENLQGMGIFITPSDASQTDYVYKNAMLLKEYSSQEWIPTVPKISSTYTLYWCPTPNATTDIVAYSPYLENAQLDAPFRFEVQADQSDNKGEYSRMSDLLYFAKTGIKPSDNNNKVNIDFEHLACKFTVQLDKVAELETETIQSVKLGGIVLSADFSLTDGSLSLHKTTPGEIQMQYDAALKSAECIILPQTVTAGSLYVTVTLSDGRDYECVLNDAYTFEKNKQYSYDVTVGISLTYTSAIRATGWNSATEDLYMED